MPAMPAEIVTGVSESGGGAVVTGNVALVAPAGMVTLAGTVAAVTLKSLVICSVTVVPPAGDGPDRSTVPVEPPVP